MELNPCKANKNLSCRMHNIDCHYSLPVSAEQAYCDVIFLVQKPLVTSCISSNLQVPSVDQETVQQWKFLFKKQKVYNVMISESRVFILLFIFP